MTQFVLQNISNAFLYPYIRDQDRTFPNKPNATITRLASLPVALGKNESCNIENSAQMNHIHRYTICYC